MPLHSYYPPYWLSYSTKQQYVVILSVLMVLPQFKYNVCLVRLLVSNRILYATATKCTMNVRLAVIHSKKTM